MNEMYGRQIIERPAKDYLCDRWQKKARPQERPERRETMKNMIFAAAALSLGMSAAFANQGGPNPNTPLPDVIAQAPRNVSTTLIHPGSSFRLGTAGLGSVS
jgi:hypothetical protein